MLIIIWDFTGPIQLDLLSHGETINAARYCEYLKRTNCDLSRRRCGSIILLEDVDRLLNPIFNLLTTENICLLIK
ncbi:hypothetical protein KIN20_032311 [Parelaphostrongylus tenuis]|uniref:Uncharacterized protein n=1 Tax=Parelaphostrongylus tenuis TaxID=148309 RepID=A0AAD5WHF8_PARTN|nr:hypothetical protein KIN20_032311 [Parelaphostrongylus tenuis]